MLPVRARRGFSRNKEASIIRLLLKKYLPLPLPLKVYYSAGRYYVDGCRRKGENLLPHANLIQNPSIISWITYVGK